jgi:autotransporter-associated beta strand protein/parallel beta-helix repeat protein
MSLSGVSNSFSGGVKIKSGEVRVNTIGNTNEISSLGTAGTIHMGSTSTTAYSYLLYTGPGETTNKVINLAGTIGPIIIINKSAGLLKFTSPVTATGIGIKTLFADQDDLNGGMEFAGAIPNSSGGATTLKKNGPGTLILSATNTFSGGVSIKGGTLELGKSSALPSGDVKFVADGTGNGMLKITYAGTGPILTNLDVDVNATIDLGTNSNSSIKFQTATGWGTTAILTITNTSGGKLYFASASGLDLSKIKSTENPTYLARLSADGLLSFISPAPVVTANQAFSITERAVASTTVGAVLATDPQSNPISGYSLVSGNTDSAFTINPITGQISVSGPLDYWGKRYYSLGVSVSNGSYSSSVETVVVTVMGYYTVPNSTYVQQPSGEVLTTINDASGSIATLQAAINAARISNPSRQIMIKLKAGARYTISNLPLTLGSNMSLSGTSSCIVANSSTTAPTLIKITNGSNMVSINNLTLEGALANLYGIEALGVSRINIDQVTVRRTILDGILLEGLGSTIFDNEMTITRCDVSECTNASGIHIKNATQAVCSENLSTYNLRGILLESCARSTLLNNLVEYNSSSGISLFEDTWCKVANNRCYGNGIGISTNGTSASNQYNFLVSNIFQNSSQGISLTGYANVLYGNSFTTNVTLPVKIVAGSGVNRILTTSNAFSVPGQDYFHPPTATNPHSEAIMNGRTRTDLITSASSLSAIQTLYNDAKITNPNNVFVLHLTASQINGDSTLVLDSNTCVILDGTINLNPGIVAFSSASSSYISLSGGVINGANTTGRHGIDFENCSRILIEKMSFLNFGSKVTRIQDSDVILLSGCTTPCVIDSCFINGGAARGIWTKGNSVNSTAGLIFVNNSISNVNMDGIDFDVTTSGSLALDNLCQANIRYGIFVEEGAKNNQVIGNTCLSNEIGINVISNVVGDTIQNSFISNTCTSNQRGIRFGASSAWETSHNFAFNNSILNSTTSGIDAQGVGVENYCSQTYFSGNALNLNATTSSVFFNSPSTTTLRPATVSLGNLAQAYDGTSKSVSVSTNPLGLSVVLNYNDLPTAPSLPGSYSVFAIINDAIYQGTATATLVISDGIANWRTNYFQTSENSGQAADGFDADGDSLVNSLEYAFGSDPTVQSSGQLLTITKNGGGFLLNFNAKQASGTGYIGLSRTYTVETTNDLTSPSSWSPLAGYANIVGANQVITINLSSITTKCFFRLKVHVE